MVKRFFSFLIVFVAFAVNSAFADDFHRTYKQTFSSQILSHNYAELNRIPIKISIINDVSTKKNLVEGQKLVFLTKEDTVLTHKKVLPAGSRIFGTVETISQNEAIGVPSNLIVGNFRIEYMPNLKLEGQIVKQGANRAYWVRPLVPFLFAVRGGHAKIKTTEFYYVHYTPPAI